MFNNVKYYIYSVLTLHKISCIVQKILQQNINRKYRIIKGFLHVRQAIVLVCQL